MRRHSAPGIHKLVIGTSLVLALVSQGRADGLPGEYLVTSRWRSLITAYSPLTNPALLTEANYIAARVALTSTLHEFYMHEIGATIPIGLYQSAGVSWLTLGTSPYERTTWGGSGGDEIVADGEISDNSNFFMLSYAINPWKRVSVGANVNIAHQNLFNQEQRLGVGLDLGLSYRLMHHPVLGDHVLGAAAQNLVPPKLGQDEAYSSVGRLSLISHYWEKRVETGFDFSVKDFLASAEMFKETNDQGAPVEAAKALEWDLNARLGVWVLRLLQLYGLMGFDQTGFEYWGFAAGFNVPSVFVGRDLAFLYQYLSMTEGGGSGHTWYVRADFGKHREEIYARKMARLANIAPNLLYNKALSLYHAGNFWDAFYVFGRIRVEFPDFFKRDWVVYYMGACLEEMDMRDISEETYETTKKEFPRSVAVPFADLGLLRLHFRNGEHQQVASQFKELNKPDVPDSLKYHGFYYMAQSHIEQGEYLKAKQLLEMVPETHPEFVFAQHSLAIVDIINGDLDGAIAALENCLQTPVNTTAQKEAVNRSYVMLGYLFYEYANQFESALAKAVTALRNVPKTSHYYEDALLGLGWTAVKARQWQDCLDAARQLKEATDRTILKAEASLLEAYALMIQKNFPAATKVLEQASTLMENSQPPSRDSLERADHSYKNMRVEYNRLAEEANRLATTRQSSHVLNKVDSLAVPRKSLKQRIDEHLRFVDDYERGIFFSRTWGKVKDDIDYALARAGKMSGIKETIKDKKQMEEKQEEIDEEIRRLKEEMEALDESETPEETE